VLLEGGPESITPDLLAYYLAGAVAFDLANPDQRSDRLADVAPALEATLRRYAQIRAATERYRSPFLERAAEAKAQGRLREFVQTLDREAQQAPGTPEPPQR